MTAATTARTARADIPKIKLLSWPGAESVLWSIVLTHLVKWAGNWAYFMTWQIRYAVGYGQGLWTVLYLKDAWDRLPVHVENLLGQHWFASQAAPQWWVTDRHDARDVGIALFATLGVVFLFSKPRHPDGDRLTIRQYARALALALAAAAVPIAAIGVLAWRVTWLHEHGWQVPARFGVLASEANGWIAAGVWITVAMGIAGGLAAKPFLRRPADDVQWFFAERSAARISSTATGLNRLRGTLVIGSPAHRKRVEWLLADDPALPKRSPWLVRGLLAIGFLSLAAAGAGAWLTLAGPAAPH